MIISVSAIKHMQQTDTNTHIAQSTAHADTPSRQINSAWPSLRG